MARRNRGRRPSRRGGNRRSGGSSMFGMSNEFLIGALVGYTDLDEKIPAEFRLMGATMPIKGFGKVKMFAQGMVFANVAKGFIGGTSSGTSSTGGV